MDGPRWRRQDGLIREALYIFLAVALVMAILLDGVAIMKAQQSARDLAADAGREAKTDYVNSGSVTDAERAVSDYVTNGDADLIAFNVQGSATDMPTFTVTVQQHTETYLFKFLGYVPGMKDWVDDVQNPMIVKSTE